MNEGMKKLLNDLFWTLNHHTSKVNDTTEQISGLLGISDEVSKTIHENLKKIKDGTWTL